jgi:hypothetical protein
MQLKYLIWLLVLSSPGAAQVILDGTHGRVIIQPGVLLNQVNTPTPPPTPDPPPPTPPTPTNPSPTPSGPLALTITPGGGTFSAAQTVSVTTTLANATIFCTTDGSPASPSGTQVGAAGAGKGTITVTTSQVLNCQAVQGAISFQNNQTSETGWKVVIASCANNACSAGTPTAQAGGGVAGNPTTWKYVWGSTLTQSMTGAAFVQILAPFSGAGSNNATAISQRKIFTTTTPATISQNIEMDSGSQDHLAAHQVSGSTTINHNFGFQCEQASDTGNPGHWVIAGGDQHGADGFHDTGVTLGCPVSLTQPTVISTQGHWIIGDTSGPAGLGYMHYDWIEINGTRFPMTNVMLCASCGFPAGVLSNEQSNFTSFIVQQDQLDIGPTAGTINRNILGANLTQFTYSASPVTASAAFVIQK